VVIKFGFSGHMLIKVSSTKFHEIPSIGNRVDLCVQRDRHGEGTRRFFVIMQTLLITDEGKLVHESRTAALQTHCGLNYMWHFNNSKMDAKGE
jgi:hypothetical protein